MLCTQLSPISCGTCFPISTPPSEDISKNSSFSGSFWEPASPAVISPQTAFPLNSPFASPPTSPKSPNINYNPYFGSFGADHDVISRRFSLNSEPESDGCDNCNFVISKDMSERLPNGAPGSPTKNGKGQHGSPILRTTQPIVAHGSEEDEEEDDEDSPTGSFAPHNSHLGTSPSTSQGSRLNSSVSSPFYPQKTHFHNLTYVTRRQPELQSVYSRLRHSCVRTLTCETLPRGSPSGPLLFGDPIAGYTIAYIFRLPDPRARGKRRTYALTALGRDCWRVIAAMVQVTKAFESIASQIISMADRVLEREICPHVSSLHPGSLEDP